MGCGPSTWRYYVIPKPGKPYVWPTWITGLLAGTDKCQWRAWVKSRYRYEKRQETPDDKARLEGWVKIHDQMVLDRAARERAQGRTVRIEDENSFRLEGSTATVGGKPDIVIIEGDKQACVVDEKSGKVKEQYIWQVLIYMFAFKVLRQNTWKVRGEIEYTSNFIVPIAPEQLNKESQAKIGEVLQMIGRAEAPPTTPSKWECLYCDVIECPDRFRDVPEPEVADATQHF